MQWYLGNSYGFNNMWSGNAWLWSMPGIFIIIALWSLVWTGLALWHAAKRDEKGWFIFFLLVHTAGIAEILYLVFVVKAFASPRTPPAHKRKRP